MTKSRICIIPSCGNKVLARGYCNSHYLRLKRHGDPLGFAPRKNIPLDFLKSVVANPPKECVIWPYATCSGGRGQVHCDAKRYMAHRLSLSLYLKRPLKDGLEVAHAPVICNNGACVNPLHLREATRTENEHDKRFDGSDNRGSRHGNSKLTEADIIAIRSSGLSQRVIALDYNVSQQTISEIKTRKSWKHL